MPMTTPTETTFLKELDKKLWTAADPGSGAGTPRPSL